MIIRVSHSLSRAVLAVPRPGPTIVPPAGAPYPVHVDFAHVELVPEWLAVAIQDGMVVVVDREDFEGIPPEVREHVEVIKW
jgi:hypothetical protein